MVENQDELKIAEEYLSEMLEADREGDYQKFTERFESVDSSEFNEDIFLSDVKQMSEDLGQYKKRIYLGSLKTLNMNGAEKSLRFVWRGFYEKNEALIVLGIHRKDGIWFVNENHIS